MAHLGLIWLLWVHWRHQKLQRMACIAPPMLSSSVASLCQTLHELARNHEYGSKTKPSPSISATANVFTY